MTRSLHVPLVVGRPPLADVLRRFLFGLLVGAALLAPTIASAATLEYGALSVTEEKATAGTEYECSSTLACEVYLTLESAAEGVRQASYIEVGGVKIGRVQITAPKKEDTSDVVTFQVPPKVKWLWTHATGTEMVGHYDDRTISIGAGVEGKEGKEGKQGKEGPPGPEGKEGPKGERGEVGGGSSDIEEFKGSASSQIDGDIEAVEVPLWILCGCIVGSVLMLIFRSDVRPW
jgi:hypothetical protein